MPFSKCLINICEIALIEVMTFHKHSSIKVVGHGRKLTALVTQVQSLRGEVSTAERHCCLRWTKGSGGSQGQQDRRCHTFTYPWLSISGTADAFSGDKKAQENQPHEI